MLPVYGNCSFLIVHSVFSNVYILQVSCSQCYLCMGIVHSWLPLRFSLTFIYYKYHDHNVTCVWELFIPDCPFGFLWRLYITSIVITMLPVYGNCPFLIVPSVFSNVYILQVSWSQCYLCMGIVHSWLSIRFSLTFIYYKYRAHNVTCVWELFIPDCPFGFL